MEYIVLWRVQGNFKKDDQGGDIWIQSPHREEGMENKQRGLEGIF